VAQEKRPEAGPAPKAETAAAPPPAESGPASIAPAMVNAPDMLFSEGAKEVITTSDSETIYKGLVERTLRAHWNRPEDVPDDKFMAEVELSVDPAGKLQHYQWLRGSGNARWDDSVKGALAATKALSRPPKGFPDKFTVRFDVETQQTEDALELSLR